MSKQENQIAPCLDSHEVRFWAVMGASDPKSFVPVEVIPLSDTDIRIGHTGLPLHKNTDFERK